MAEWLRSGLQIRVPRFDSGWCLQFHSAVAFDDINCSFLSSRIRLELAIEKRLS